MLILLLLFFVLVMVWLLVAVFLATAKILLPWTITAVLLAMVASLVFVRGASTVGKPSAVIASLGAFVLTFVFGGLGCLMVTPVPPGRKPVDPQREMMENLIVPTVKVSQEDIWKMLPYHLAIAGACAAVATATLAPSVEIKTQPATAAEQEVTGDADDANTT